MQPSGTDVMEDIERALDEGDGWAVMDDTVLDGMEAMACDCTLMTISLGGLAVQQPGGQEVRQLLVDRLSLIPGLHDAAPRGVLLM